MNTKTDIVFTRYLYIKDEVRIALLVSILNKSNDAIFWGYELYYSGFKNELFELLWKIYYDFFATLNPAYEAYLLKKHKEYLKPDIQSTQSLIVSSIIQDLLFRPFNTDVFFLRNCCENFEIDIEYYNGIKNFDIECNIDKWMQENDYRSFAQWILNVNNDSINLDLIYNICLDIFEKNGIKLTKLKLMKEFMSALKISSNKNDVINVNKNVVLLAKIMHLFSKQNGVKMGRSIYINVEPEEIIMYETIVGLKNYKILEKACVCGIDDFKYLSLFKLRRNKYSNNSIKEIYWNHWEYYASFSPVWLERMNRFKGQINHITRKVVFIEEPDDDLMQEFYELYGYEPDEQKTETQNKSVIDIDKVNNWTSFYNNFKNNGIFRIYEEELDEFDSDGLQY